MKTYISLTVLPSRLNKLKATIDSIINQSILPEKILVWLPLNCRRDNKEIVKIPKFLECSLIETEYVQDIGSATKLLPALKKFWGDNDVQLITIDDDVIYPKNFIKGLLEATTKFPNTCLGYRGRNFITKNKKYNETRLFTSNKINESKEVDIITGTWGALYKPTFFTDEVFTLDVNTPAFFTDDIWFMGHLAKNKVKRVILPLNEKISPREVSDIKSLWSINKGGHNNNYTINLFKKYF